MPNILNNLSRLRRAFQPGTVSEFLALQLARKLGEPIHAGRYIDAVEHFPLTAVVRAYRRALKQDCTDCSRSELFDRALHHNDESPEPTQYRLCSIKVQRREISVAVFSGLRLDFIQERHLSVDSRKAASSALGFLHWVFSNLETDSAALETVSSNQRTRRNNLTGALLSALRTIPAPVWQVEKKDILERFALPAPKTRKKVRGIVSEIWPILNDRSVAILDAVALGLAVQTERLLS